MKACVISQLCEVCQDRWAIDVDTRCMTEWFQLSHECIVYFYYFNRIGKLQGMGMTWKVWA